MYHGRMSAVAASPIPEFLEELGFHSSGRRDCLAVKATTFEEYLDTDTGSLLAEWVDGETRVYMANTLPHQRILGLLSTLVAAFANARELGVVVLAGYAIQARSGGAGREPDLLFVSRGRRHLVTSRYLQGAPDLAVEIVSRESVERDYVEKFREYEADGVREYWLIDSRPGKNRADFFVLRDGRFEPAFADATGVYHSTVLGGFALQTSWLWDEEPPLADALREILAGEPS
jgi:Uma2 family endonuclease